MNNPSGADDFDFFNGQWHIKNTRLKQRLTNCTEWETFNAEGHNRKLPGGIGNYDHFIADAWRPGFVGMSFRVFSPETKKWSIYWLDNVTGGLDAQGSLNAPVVGEFKNGVGIFECDDTLNGEAIRVRYMWSNITANTARWEQAFSPDNGVTWECNWIMERGCKEFCVD